MKKIILSFFLSCFPFLLLAQQIDTIYSTQGIPYSIVQKVPVFPGCEELAEGTHSRCFQDSMRKFIYGNFNNLVVDSLELTPGKYHIYLQFLLGKDGNIYAMKSRSIHKNLDDEAVRVLSKLPKMVPGIHHGRKVNVKYTMPIIFTVADKSKK